MLFYIGLCQGVIGWSINKRRKEKLKDKPELDFIHTKIKPVHSRIIEVSVKTLLFFNTVMNKCRYVMTLEAGLHLVTAYLSFPAGHIPSHQPSLLGFTTVFPFSSCYPSPSYSSVLLSLVAG